MEEQEHKTSRFGNFHDKYYKSLLLIPISILLFCSVYLFFFYSNNHDIFHKDISLTGGTSVTIQGGFDSSKIEADLSSKLKELNTRDVFDLVTNEKKAVIIETRTDSDTTKKVLEDYLGYQLTNENSSFEFTGESLSQSFYQQLIIALIFAFIFMSVVVFILFRTFVPSLAVILSAFADIFMTLIVVDILGIEMSSAGIVALLMLIGYSVDTDILLTTRLLKREEGELNNRIFGAFKTGITMTLTASVAVLSALLIVRSFSLVLTQIFTIISIGLVFDIINTWVTNVSILKWYVKKKHK
jgi:preprotein translocase subunit SecF